MDDKDKQIPDWLPDLRNNIFKSEQHWENVYAEGEADIRRGLESTKIARQQLQGLRYLKETFRQELPASIWSDEIVNSAGVSLVGTVSFYEHSVRRIATDYNVAGRVQQDAHERFLISANTFTATAGSMVYISAEIEKRIESLNADYQPIFVMNKPEPINSRLEVLTNLKQILRAYNPKYIHMLNGSEEALLNERADHLSQAAHSMRDLFQQLIEDLAPSDAVSSQPWFVATPEAPGGVSRKSRLRYMLYGTGKNLNEEELNHLDKVAEQAKRALDLSIARAHEHDVKLTRDEVKMAIDHARFSLLEVLKRYTQRREAKRVR